MSEGQKPQWNGMCPAGKHGLDYEGQDCDVCRHEAGGPCSKICEPVVLVMARALTRLTRDATP